MKNYTLMNYEFVFGDHFSNVSDKARLLYIEMLFFANNGFVTNAKAIMDARDYDGSVMTELVANGDVLRLEGREEVFLTAFYLHNKGINSKSWQYTPYYVYWANKLWIKKNGVATFKPQAEERTYGFSHKVKVKKEYQVNSDPEMDALLAEIETRKSSIH